MVTSRPADHAVARVRATTPVRIADVGGWTDTWFAGAGAVCHLGVGPGVTVDAVLHAGPPPARPVRLVASNLGEDYRCGPSTGWNDPEPGRHPLLEHAIASVCARLGCAGPVTVAITSSVPPGASLGTSASVVVALIAALECLLGDPGTTTASLDDADRRRIAETAHRVETVAAARESGVQDQYAAAFGRAQLLEITDYPTTRRSPIELDDEFARALEQHTVTVVLGAHDSSSVHAAVIAALTDPRRGDGPTAGILTELRDLALEAAAGLHTSNLESWAATLTEATEAQERLHGDLVGPHHRELIAAARAEGALGWKVNGAGGDGGSLTVVCTDPDAARRFTSSIETRRPEWIVQDLVLHDGVAVRRVDR